MARKRQIKPAFFENEELGADGTDPLIPLLFAGLWPLADRDGRLKDRPRWIKARIFPYRTVNDPDGLLAWLADHGFIIRYESGGERFIQVTNWHKHQSPHQNETPSAIPPPFCEPFSDGQSPSPDGDSTTPCLKSKSVTSSNNGVPPVAAETAAVETDPVERRIWEDGVRILSHSGLSERHARPLLGRLAKEYGKALLAESIAATQAENPADPKAFLIKTLKQRSVKNPDVYVGRSTDDHKPVEITVCPRCGDECCLGGRSCEERAAGLKAAA